MTRLTARHLFAALAVACFLCGCGSAGRCTPGASAPCACPDGRAGAQSCLPDGTYGTCLCAPVADGVAVYPSAGGRGPQPSAAPGALPPGALPAPDDLAWASLERPWTRLFLDPLCDRDTYGNLPTQPTWTWRTTAGVPVVLRVRTRDTSDGSDGARELVTRTLELVGERPGAAEPYMLGTLAEGLGGSCGESRALVVYAGRRTDGLLLISLELLAQPAGSLALPGESTRYIYGWDAVTDAPRQLGTWNGLTNDAPDLYRVRPPRAAR